MSPSLLASVGVVLFVTTPLTAQDFCQHALADRPFPTLRNATNPEPTALYWSATWQLAFARQAWLDSVSRGVIKPRGDYSFQEWFRDSTDIPSAIKALAPKDSVARWRAAFELAEMFDGPIMGRTEGMSWAAASLYRAWRLPPEPAAALLADPPVGTNARTRAVIALAPYVRTTTFRKAAAAALCILAANAQGRATLRHTDTLSWFDAFDMEEHQLLSGIIWALGSVAEQGGPSADSVIALLPPKNPLTRWLRGELSQ